MKGAESKVYSLFAVVPAAGRGSRLGMEVPKVFVSLFPSLTIWDAIHEKVARVADRAVLVLSPEGKRFLAANRGGFSEESFQRTEIACQEKPLGMGDAIFAAADLWREAENLLIVWGDQFNLSLKTLQACVALQRAQRGPALTLPLVRMAQPYVEYVFDSAGHLAAIRQSREGEVCAPDGWADVGVFLLSGGALLLDAWRDYRATASAGATTGEVNFLPFLVYLSTVAGWPVSRYEGGDAAEAWGINTPEDLARAREILRSKKSTI